MTISRRQQVIVKRCLEEEVSATMLAEILHCSEKTIRNELKSIDQWLTTFGASTLVRHPRKGIFITGTLEEVEQINNRLAELSKVLSEEEYRKLAIIQGVFLQKKKITVTYLRERLFVNKNILRDELYELQQEMLQYQLYLQTSKRDGIVVEGDEKAVRSFLVSTLLQVMQHRQMGLKDLFLTKDFPIEAIETYLRRIERDNGICYSDHAFLTIITLLFIVVIRVKIGKEIPKGIYGVEEKEGWKGLADFEEKLEQLLSLSLPREERVYIESVIKGGQKHYPILNEKVEQEGYVEILVRQFIILLEKYIGVSFSKDTLLYKHFHVHFQSFLNRSKSEMYVYNPLTSYIKNRYYFLYDGIQTIFLQDKTFQTMDVTEDEIAFMVLHFQGAYARLVKQRHRKKRAIVVCSYGIGMGMLMKTKIEQCNEKIEVVDIVRECEVKQYDNMEGIDFILSAVPLVHDAKPVLEISPLFSAGDEEKIQALMKGMEAEQVTFSVFPMHVQLPSIFIEERVSTIEDAIRFYGDMLVSKGYVAPAYVQSVLEREEKAPTSIGNGFLIPHGDRAHIHHSTILFVHFKEPIVHGKEMIRNMIFLAYLPEDVEEHQALFKEIVAISESKVFQKEMSTKEEIWNVFFQ